MALSDLIPLEEAVKLLPWEPARSTVWRWRDKGFDGVKLDVRYVGRKPFTTVAALEQFTARQPAPRKRRQKPKAESQVEASATAVAAPPKPSRREQEIRRAEHGLEAAGF